MKKCSTDLNQLIRPTVSFDEWSWEADSQMQQAGNDTPTDDFFFSGAGSYTMSINNGGCTVTSEPLEYQTVSCGECPTTKPFVKTNDLNTTTPYCSYTIQLEIINTLGIPYQLTLSDVANNVVISPASFTVDPSITLYTFTVIPITPFAGGLTQWMLQGNLPSSENAYEQCQYFFDMYLLECGENNESSKTALAETELSQGVQHQVNLFPNPAKESVAVQYTLNSTASIALFDLTGRQVAEHQTATTSGEWNLNTASFPGGIYIVVVKQTNGHVEQHKLVIE